MAYNIAIDCREHGLREYFSTDPHYSFVNLEVGDIVFYIEDEIKLIIERKTIPDLYSSIRDGRHREQKARLFANYPKSKILYLLEGSVLDNQRRMNIDVVYGSIVNTILRDNLRIIHSSSIEETAKYISIITKRLTEKPEFFASGGGGIDAEPDYATTIKLKKKDNLTPQLCQILQLAQIPSLSVTKAKIIIAEYGNISKLMDYLRGETQEDLINLKINDRKLGNKAVDKLREYLL
jgi:ERCC4-type nuclease